MTTCPICQTLATVAASEEYVCESEHWILKHAARPYPIAGWLVLISKRHVAGPAFFSEAEQAAIGPAISTVSRAIIDRTGALRVYVASMNESSPHFHMHLVPRYENGPPGWSLFAEQQRAAKGDIQLSEDAVLQLVRDLRASSSQWMPARRHL
jgi:diadenosine tetraphosphate (Ap4A) HIT family hydrolase